MKTQNILLPVALLVAGIVIGSGGFKVVDAKNHQTSSMHGDSAMSGMGHDMSTMSMGEMASELEGLTGDEFDKMFISSMIAHHEGAIDMANAAKSQANHAEIKTLADDIIAAQTKEISQMKEWEKLWEY